MSKYKGLDDLLAAGLKPKCLQGSEVGDYFARVRAELNGDKTRDQEAPPPHSASPLGPAATSDPVAPPASGALPLPSSASPSARPSFPVEVYPERVRRFCHRVADALRCPIDFVGLAVLV